MKFPFSLWRKTMREVLSEYELELVQRAHFLGVPPLRKAIADYLYRSRGMSVSPECIVIGASIEYLYESSSSFCRSAPSMARKIPDTGRFRAFMRNSAFHGKALKWMNPASAWTACGKAAQISSMFPRSTTIRLGLVTTAGRRQELLSWAAEAADRYIIEDDYDCEFRYSTKSIPACRAWI